MVSSTYFTPCPNHTAGSGKGDLTNLFCLETGETLCASCAGGREVVQVRPSPVRLERVSISTRASVFGSDRLGFVSVASGRDIVAAPPVARVFRRAPRGFALVVLRSSSGSTRG